MRTVTRQKNAKSHANCWRTLSQLLVSDAQTAAVKAIFSSLKTLVSLENA
jgi:hypothetical protein